MNKKLILLASIALAGSFSCTKNNDSIKAQLEKALPPIELTSLGLILQTSPFSQSDVIQVSFGGALTRTEPGAFDIAWYDAPSSGTPKLIDSTHFASWNVTASSATGNNGVSYTVVPSTYPHTISFSGSLNLKLTKLPTGGKAYSLKAYARTKDGQMATVSLTRFITVN